MNTSFPRIIEGSILSVNGMQAIINTPPALKGEGLHQLPPHRPVKVYVVDEYPACPDNWEHGSDMASSYFVSLEEGNGMWFNFTANEKLHVKHHVAVVVSVQGINPVTNKPITALNFEQYRKKCPIHNVDFQQDRYCPECQYKWPAQNYISTTTGKQLWIDGFMNAQGETRQYIISAEEAQGIAKQIEDKDPEFKRVWAIGFAFYQSVEQKPAPPPQPQRCNDMLEIGMPSNIDVPLGAGGGTLDSCCLDYEEHTGLPNSMKTTQPPKDQSHLYNGGSGPPSGSKGSSMSYSSQPAEPMNFVPSGPQPQARSLKMKSSTSPLKRNVSAQSITRSATAPVTPVKKIEVGAGARINQNLGADPNDIEFWRSEPVGMIYVNLTDPETLQKILDAGRRQDKPEGSLNGLRVGNAD